MKKRLIVESAVLMVLGLAAGLVSVAAFADGDLVTSTITVEGKDWSYVYEAISGQEPGGSPDYKPYNGPNTTYTYGEGYGSGHFDSRLNIRTGSSLTVDHRFEIDGFFDISYQGSAVWCANTPDHPPNSGFVDHVVGFFSGDGYIDGKYHLDIEGTYPTVIGVQKGYGHGEVFMEQRADAGGCSTWGPSSGSVARSFVSVEPTSKAYYDVRQSMTVQQHTYSLAGDVKYDLWGSADKAAGFTYTQKHHAANPFEFVQYNDNHHEIYGKAELGGFGYYPVLEGKLAGKDYTANFTAGGAWGVDFKWHPHTSGKLTIINFSMERPGS